MYLCFNVSLGLYTCHRVNGTLITETIYMYCEFTNYCDTSWD